MTAIKKGKKISGFTGVYTNEMLQDYLSGEFTKSVVDWNNKVGKGVVEGMSCNQVLQMVLNQSKRVMEECNEGLEAYLDNNKTERIDALVDIQFTKVMLDEYMEALDKFSDEEITEASLNFSEDELLILQIVPQLLAPAIIASQGVNLTNPKQMYISCELIIANNEQKYTDSVDVMETWKANLKEGQQIKTTTVDGVDYYSIVRLEDGKVEKSFDFVPVVLDLH